MRGRSFALLQAMFFMLSVTFVNASMAFAASVKLLEIPSNEKVISRHGQYEQSEINTDEPLRLTVWNVHKFDKQITFKYVEDLANKSDIVLLQESMMSGQYDRYFNSYFNIGWTAVVSFIDEGFGTGVSTGSRMRPTLEGFIRSDAREPVLNTPKMIALTKYKLKNSEQELLVANIHGINFVSAEVYATQIAQLDKAINNHTGPLIVAGDFNTYSVDRAMVLRRLADRQKLDYVWIENRHINRLNLDHIYTRGLEAISAHEIRAIKSSDHLPLYAVFKFVGL
jgi:endonuclease/exonuclease/phosphatase (EEP) superfamily protein YafD